MRELEQGTAQTTSRTAFNAMYMTPFPAQSNHIQDPVPVRSKPSVDDLGKILSDLKSRVNGVNHQAVAKTPPPAWFVPVISTRKERGLGGL